MNILLILLVGAIAFLGGAGLQETLITMLGSGLILLGIQRIR